MLTASPPGAPRYGSTGMVASSSGEAAAVGANVLLTGGNAFDAAVAVALVEGLTLPACCGLGGDAFAVLFDARSGRVHAINGSGAAPLAAGPGRYLSRGAALIPSTGWDSVAVPGEAHALWTLHQRFGTRPWAELLLPAIRRADQGVAVSGRIHRWFGEGPIAAEPNRSTLFPDGESPAEGSRWRRPGYAWTLRNLASEGVEGFYRGEVAAEIVSSSEAGGGLFSMADLARHETEVYEPIRTDYRGITVWETRPPSQGFVLLEILNIFEGLDGRGDTVQRAHNMIEATKLAFEDRVLHAGDPAVVDMPLAQLTSKGHAASRRKAIDPHRARMTPGSGGLGISGGDTTSFCVADAQGNAVSFIHSLFGAWGSGVVAGRTGIVLNNRGRAFYLRPGHRNQLAGGKRPMHTLNCYLLSRDGVPWIVGGTPGGDFQVQWNAQVISNLIDAGMDLQQAVEAPRWHLTPGSDPARLGEPFEVRIESRGSGGVIDGLRSRGHAVVDAGPWDGGWCQLIALDPGGVLKGASDPRAGGVALGV